jgi:TetR/AcrR family transcriptional regulator of autoinduction and epiphytic fitness
VSQVEVTQNASGNPEHPEHPIHPDGRRARRDRNREAVVDAYLDLINEGQLEPSVAAVAERSKVSHRSVFRYFSDRESLVQAGIECQIRRAEPFIALTVTPDMALDVRISGFAEQRATLHERLGSVARLARLRSDQNEQIGAMVGQARTFFRNQAKQLFQPEFDAMDPTEAGDTLAAIDVFTSFEAFDLLRRVQGMSQQRITRILEESITALLRR